MSRRMRPEMLAEFGERHGDLGENLQAVPTHNSNNAAQYWEDAELSQLDAVLLLSFLEAQHLRVESQSAPATGQNNRSGNHTLSHAQNDSLDSSELDAALALSLEEEEPRSNSSLPAAGNLSLDHTQNELDAALALSLEEEEEPRANPSLSAAGNLLLNYTQNNSLDLELDAAITLSLEEQAEEEEEEEEFIAQSSISAADERGATPPSISVPVTAQDDDITFEAVGSESRGLSKELFDSFPVQKLVTKSGWFSSSRTDPEGCPICVSDYEVGSMLLTLPCLHLYHKSCIKDWLKLNKTCPLCKTDISVPPD